MGFDIGGDVAIAKSPCANDMSLFGGDLSESEGRGVVTSIFECRGRAIRGVANGGGRGVRAQSYGDGVVVKAAFIVEVRRVDFIDIGDRRIRGAWSGLLKICHSARSVPAIAEVCELLRVVWFNQGSSAPIVIEETEVVAVAAEFKVRVQVGRADYWGRWIVGEDDKIVTSGDRSPGRKGPF